MSNNNILPIKPLTYTDENGREKSFIPIGHEKAIYGEDNVTLDTKIQTMQDNITDAFSTEKDYAVGDYCIYLNGLYKFTEEKEAGAWDGSKVVPVSISNELKGLGEYELLCERSSMNHPNWPYDIKYLRVERIGRICMVRATITVNTPHSDWIFAGKVDDETFVIPPLVASVQANFPSIGTTNTNNPIGFMIELTGKIGVVWGTQSAEYRTCLIGFMAD